MGKVVYWMSVSLDGYVETREGKIDFTAPSEGLHRVMNDDARKCGAFLHGRATYDLMAAYWPQADRDPSAPAAIAEFAAIWRGMPKLVFSRTMRSAGHGYRLAGPDIRAEVAKAKREFDGDLGVCGAGLAASFIADDLVDEYRLYVRPIVLGGGKPYFPKLDRPLDLRLVESRAFPDGVVRLRYDRPR